MPTNAILLGAGQRGQHVYGKYATQNPNKLKFVTVADPDRTKRETFAQKHSIPDKATHKNWENALKNNTAEICVIATPDFEHTDPAIAALHQNYHVLTEKGAYIFECPTNRHPKHTVLQRL